ncbi:4-hydroxy-tetrahydrodipicolinate reductase [Longirhabdus pacifica]|uniref:4-hydroxy-tetrahydrodipicolinate reductase n=1 Tax=Longirhabdus pacifica TaxID=2305227 RepID=UPI0023EA6F1D|nr:4-hydroxy-tetrahydrodipicolinate reductase [Longirhabdus pacifica]
MTTQKIKVAVAGARGKMGREVVKMVLDDAALQLVAAIDTVEGEDIGTAIGLPHCGVTTSSDLGMSLAQVQPDVLVDFTVPQVAYSNTKVALQHGVRPIVGTTGFTPEQIAQLKEYCEEHRIGALIAPNFSIGAILMMKFAAEASKYLPNVEIIEYHGDQKLDAPSGTAIKTAEKINEQREEMRQGNIKEEETIEGARGGYYHGFRIHSVRLPGVFAQQEVIFGGDGQTLKIRHDSYDRAGYMPGVNVAIKKVMHKEQLVYGFEHFLEDEQ